MELMNLIILLRGFILAFAYDDLSKDKVATQSTTYPPPPNDADKNVAGNAVDRDITTCMRTESIGPNSPDKTVWWKVDLGGVYGIYSVNILFMNYEGFERRQQSRFAGFSIYVSSNGTRDNTSLCYKDGPKLPALNFTTTCITSGRYVTFYNERLKDVTYPDGYADPVYTELCEVTVHGCQASGVYGVSCMERCPINCRDNVCHIQKGTCFGCEPGWIDTTCNTKIRKEHIKPVSNIKPAAIRGTVGACIIVIVSAALILIWRKRSLMSGTTDSHYAEIEIRRTEDSTYQQLNTSGLGTDNPNQQQNVSKLEPDNTYQQLNVSRLETEDSNRQQSIAGRGPDNTYQQLNVSELEPSNTYQELNIS